ncbi:MAG TPA: hypothetical protein VFB80_02760 [Pirellulaceae bacterium]|nr:hypothetical protein [Pirellulaceae bacterium]
MTLAGENTPLSRAFDALLTRLSIEPRMFRALVRAFVLMDFRNQQFARSTATGPKAVISPLFWVLGQNLIVGLICAVVMFARVDAFFFALVCLGISCLMTATSLVVEFNEVVLTPDDLDVVGHLPVPLRTYAAARMANLLVYVLVVLASLNLYPAIVGAGLRDAPWWWLPAYSAAALVSGLVTGGIVILIYAVVMRGKDYSQSQELLAWVQVVMILVLFYGGQLALRDAQQGIQMAAYRPPEFVHWLPTTWLARAVAADVRWPVQSHVGVIGGFLLAAVVLSACVAAELTQLYGRLQPGSATWRPTRLRPLAPPGALSAPLATWLTRPGEERTGYWLAWTMLRRDVNLTMRCWPSFGIVLAALALGYFSSQLANPFLGASTKGVLSLAAIYLLAPCLPPIFQHLNASREHAASWVLRSAPLANRFAFAEGIRKAVTYRLAVPVLLLLSIVFIIAWRDPVAGVLHVVPAWLTVWAAGCVCQATVLARIPFSQPLVRGESFGPIALVCGAFSAVGTGLAVVHCFLAPSLPGYAAYLLALTLAALIVRWMAARRLAPPRLHGAAV